MICPNLNDPEVAKKFRLLESIVPESAYYLWNKYQGEVPAKYYNLAASNSITDEDVMESRAPVETVIARYLRQEISSDLVESLRNDRNFLAAQTKYEARQIAYRRILELEQARIGGRKSIRMQGNFIFHVNNPNSSKSFSRESLWSYANRTANEINTRYNLFGGQQIAWARQEPNGTTYVELEVTTDFADNIVRVADTVTEEEVRAEFELIELQESLNKERAAIAEKLIQGNELLIDGEVLPLNGEFAQRVIIEKAAISEANVERYTNTLNKLVSRFPGVTWKWDSSIPGAGKIDMNTGVVLLNPYFINDETPWHEFGHILVRGIKQTNPELFESLKREVIKLHDENPTMSAKTLVESLYPDYTGDKFWEEVITTELGRQAADFSPKTGIFAKIKKFFTDLLASLGMYGAEPKNLSDLVKSLHDPDASFEFYPKSPELSDYMESRLLSPEQQDAITIYVKKDPNAPNEFQTAAEQIKLITEAITESDMGRMIERNKYFAAEELRKSESLPAAGDILNKNKGRLVATLTKEDVAEAVLDFAEYVRYMTIYLNSIQRHIAALQKATDIPPGKKLGDYHRAYLQAQAVKKQIDALLGVVANPNKGLFGPELRESIEQAKNNPALFKNHPIAKALFWMQQSVNTIISNHEGLIQEPVLEELEEYFKEAAENLKTVYNNDINNFMSRLTPDNYDVTGQSLPTDPNVRATNVSTIGSGVDLKMRVSFNDGTERDYSLGEFTKQFSLKSKAVERLINKASNLQKEFDKNVPTKDNIRKQLSDTNSTWFAALDTASTTKNAGIQIIATYLQGLDSDYRASLVGMRGELERLTDEVFDAQGPQFAGSIVDSKTFYDGMYREVPLYEVVDGKLVTDKIVLALNNSTDTIAMRNRMTELKFIIDYSMNEIADLDPNDNSTQAQARRLAVTQKIEQAAEDLKEFQAKYTERPFTDEYYEIQEQLPQDIRDRRNELYRAMAASRASFVSADTVDYDDYQLLRSYQKELDDMESFYDTNGNLKPENSEGYRVAKAIYDWKNLRRANQVVEFPPLNQETQELFQAALNSKKAELTNALAAASTPAEKQAAYDDYNRWLDIYTRTIYKQEFYDERQAIIDQIQEILGEQGPQLKTAYESLFNLLLGKKDRDGHYKPSEINDNVRRTAKAIEEEIENIKAIDKSKSPLSKQDKEDLKDLFAELQDLQSSTNSKYYEETVASIKASLRTQITGANPTLETADIEELVHKAFRESQWFQDNHIIKSRYDKDIQQMVSVYEPLYFWRVTVPNNPSYVDKEAPSFYWYTPKVSEQFRNPKYSPGNVTFKETTSGPYYNASYANLSAQQKSALENLRAFYYKSQEGNYAKDKPGDVLPGVYKTGAENAIDLVTGRANPLANIIEESKNFVLGARTAMSDVDETTEEDQLDPYGNPIERESRKLFIRYSKPLPIEQQSYDLLRSIGLYAESSARFKSLRNLQSTVLAMEEVYENLSGIKEGGVVRDLIDRQFYGKVVNNPKHIGGKIMNAIFNIVGRLAGSKSLAYNVISAPVNQFTGYKNNLIFTKSNGLTYANYLAAYKETFGLSYDFFTSHNQTGMQPLRMQIIDFFGGTQANYSEDFAKLTNRGLRRYSKFWRAVGTYREYTEYDIAAMTTFAFLDKYNVTADDGTIYKLKDAFELVDGVLSIKPNIKISPAFLQKIRDDIRLANYRAQGVYDKLGQPTVAKYSLVRQLLFLKKWMPQHLKTEWGGGTIHYGSGIKTIGAHRAFGRFLQETFYENGKFWTGYQNLTAAERAGLQQFGLNYGMFVMFANAIGAMSAYMNCEDDGEANWKDYFCFFSKKINNEVEGVFTIWGANEFLFTYLRENANGIGGFEKFGWSLFGPFSVFRKFADFDGGLYSTDPYYKYRPNSSKIDWDRTHPTQAGKPGLQVLAMELLGARGLSLGLDAQSMDYQNRAFNSYMPKTYTRDLRTRYKENYGGVETMKTRTIGGQLKLQYKKQLKEIQKKMQAYTSSGREVPASIYEEMTDLQTRFAKAVSEMDARKDTDRTYTPALFRPYFLTREGLDITEEF